MNELVKIVVHVPLTHADIVRKAIGDSGAGAVGKYSHCSFSVRGIGRSKPMEGADPFIGTVGETEEIEEESIEVICERSIARDVIKAIKEVHPYEETAIEISPIISELEL
jgi:hypothetical protein